MKKPAEIAPLFPLQDRYFESLKRYHQEVGLLVGTCEALLTVPGALASEVSARKLKERCDAVNLAATGVVFKS